MLSILISYVGDTLFDLFIVWKVTYDSGNIMNAAYMIGGFPRLSGNFVSCCRDYD